MRKSSVAAFAVLSAAFFLIAGPARSAVIISELCDPQNNYQRDRFIEIYNTGPDAVNLTGWHLIAMGNTADIHNWTLSGTINAGQAKVAGATAAVGFTVDFASPTWDANNGTWNGGNAGDGARLVNGGGTVTDRVYSTSPYFVDADYVRKPSITVPNPTYTPSEWTLTPVANATNASPGTHTIDQPPAGGPVISAIVTSPAFPLAGAPVDVQASVVDTAAALTSVALAWGTTSGSQPNSIPMTVLSGSTHQTSAPIPAQAAGVTVYYKVQATDAAAGSSTSALQSYALHYDLTIAQIQGGAASSPYNGSAVITQGVVTSRFGTLFTVQDGAGSWNGMWARATTPPLVGDVVTVRGTVTENDGLGYAGNTLLTSAEVMSATPGGTLPAPVVVATGSVLTEAYEGVLAKVANANCTNPNTGNGQWIVNDGSGTALIDRIGYTFTPSLNTGYDVTGTVMYSSSAFKLEPRSDDDIVAVGDVAGPSILWVYESSDSTLRVAFSEPVEEVSAETATNYSVGALIGVTAVRDPVNTSQVEVVIRDIPAGACTLTVNGVADLFANATAGANRGFTWIDTRIPAGYYAGATGLIGSALRVALHNIIKNHTVKSYDYAYTAFETSDIKPHGKVWDMYSDVPGGTPPYEYDFDDHAGGAAEGDGYNREHSWPQSWFGEASPMRSDLWILYPTDIKVNNMRSNYPYGEVGSPTQTSLNGCKVGTNVAPGYGGTVFEPIDAYKGDLARGQFYVATRYFNEDGSWPNVSPSADGAELYPWAAELYANWSAADPVSWKEKMRNGAIYLIQNNRNPFVDHPEYITMIYDSSAVTAVGDRAGRALALRPCAPNPFGERTTIRFDLARSERASLRIFDLAGRRVRTLMDGALDAGGHEVVWDGRDDAGSRLDAGLYFCRLDAGASSETRRIVFTH